MREIRGNTPQHVCSNRGRPLTSWAKSRRESLIPPLEPFDRRFMLIALDEDIIEVNEEAFFRLKLGKGKSRKSCSVTCSTWFGIHAAVSARPDEIADPRPACWANICVSREYEAILKGT